jgi:hypothetical protein
MRWLMKSGHFETATAGAVPTLLLQLYTVRLRSPHCAGIPFSYDKQGAVYTRAEMQVGVSPGWSALVSAAVTLVQFLSAWQC